MAAAQDLTASRLLDIQAARISMFGGDSNVNPLDRDPNRTRQSTISPLLSLNQATTSPITEQGAGCVGVRILSIGGEFEPDDADVSAGFAGQSCDLPDGNYPETSSTSFAHNMFEQEVFSITNNECKEFFSDPNAQGMDAIAELLATKEEQALISLRNKLNQKALAFLAANATAVNRDDNMPSYITFDVATQSYQVDKEGFFADPDCFTDLMTIADLNDMNDYFTHSGRSNLRSAEIDARFRRLNDNQRYLVRFDGNDEIGPLSFDLRMDAVLGEKNTFMVNRRTYAAWNARIFPSAPTLFNGGKDLTIYSIPDTELLVNEGGVLRPAVINVKMQRTCGNTLANGKMTETFKFVYQYVGGLALAPVAQDGHTGILRFVDKFTGI